MGAQSVFALNRLLGLPSRTLSVYLKAQVEMIKQMQKRAFSEPCTLWMDLFALGSKHN
jgi:hypothetical protein